MTDYQTTLLKSLLKKAKFLDMGKSPVEAIRTCWQLEADGYVEIKDGWVHLTQQGREWVKDE